MADTAALILFLLSSAAFILLLIALIKPTAKIFKHIHLKPKTRKGLSKVLVPVWLLTFIGFVIVAPPVPAEVSSINLEESQEVVTDSITVDGTYKGNFTTLEINGNKPTLEGNKFRTTVNLMPGDNEIKLLAKAKDGDRIITVKDEHYHVYFDYEGMLYEEQLKKDQAAQAELEMQLATVPRYEVVRKENMDGGFSAIIYMDGRSEDYLVANAIKHFESKNTLMDISLLVFESANKEAVEGILESENVQKIAPFVLANYEKRADKEELFLFPTGLNGSKLAVEI